MPVCVQAWTWGKQRDTPWLTNICWLKARAGQAAKEASQVAGQVDTQSSHARYLEAEYRVSASSAMLWRLK